MLRSRWCSHTAAELMFEKPFLVPRRGTGRDAGACVASSARRANSFTPGHDGTCCCSQRLTSPPSPGRPAAGCAHGVQTRGSVPRFRSATVPVPALRRFDTSAYDTHRHKPAGAGLAYRLVRWCGRTVSGRCCLRYQPPHCPLRSCLPALSAVLFHAATQHIEALAGYTDTVLLLVGCWCGCGLCEQRTLK